MKLDRIVRAAGALLLTFVVCTGMATAADKDVPAGKININTASVQQLATLPGVGEKLAARIVEYRQKAGTFKSVRELMNVRGIGEKNLAKLQPHLTAGEAPAKAN